MDKISPEEKIQWMKKILQKKESIIEEFELYKGYEEYDK